MDQEVHVTTYSKGILTFMDKEGSRDYLEQMNTDTYGSGGPHALPRANEY